MSLIFLVKCEGNYDNKQQLSNQQFFDHFCHGSLFIPEDDIPYWFRPSDLSHVAKHVTMKYFTTDDTWICNFVSWTHRPLDFPLKFWLLNLILYQTAQKASRRSFSVFFFSAWQTVNKHSRGSWFERSWCSCDVTVISGSPRKHFS